MKLYVDAGHTPDRPGTLAHTGMTEHFYNVNFQSKIVRAYRTLGKFASINPVQGSTVVMDGDKGLSDVIRTINETSKRGDYCLSIHFNPDWQGATGTEVFVHPATTQRNKNIATYIVNRGSKIMGIPVRMTTSRRDYKYPSESFLGSLAIIERVKIPVILWEVCFLNENDLWRFTAREFTLAHMVVDAYNR